MADGSSLKESLKDTANIDYLNGRANREAIASKTANYTVVLETDEIVRFDTTSGNLTGTIPLKSSVTDDSKLRRIVFEKTTSDTNTLTVSLSGSDTFTDGTSSVILYKKGDTVAIGVGYNEIIKLNQPFFDDEVYWTYDDLFGSALEFSSGGWGGSYISTDLDENTVDFAASGSLSDSDKRAIFNVQLVHKIVEGANAYFRMHFHYMQTDSTERDFAIQYRKAKKGAIGGSAVAIGSWTTLTTVTTNATNNFYTYSSGSVHQVCQWDEIDITDMKISDIIEFRVARTDSNSGDLKLMYIDAHVRISSRSSIYKWVKK